MVEDKGQRQEGQTGFTQDPADSSPPPDSHRITHRTPTSSLGPALSSGTRMEAACPQGGTRIGRLGRGRDGGLGGEVYAGHGPMAPLPRASRVGLERREIIPAEARLGRAERLSPRASGLPLREQRYFLECFQLSWEGCTPHPASPLPSGAHTTGTLLEEGTWSRGNKDISVPPPSTHPPPTPDRSR